MDCVTVFGISHKKLYFMVIFKAGITDKITACGNAKQAANQNPKPK
jgi:hypothetical protein